ncbi:MAG: STAS domain-containing protein [Flavobacteriales bacterium]|jgi:anti-sigma B factor antagonist|nr:STAS domain-containing protein [Flavobacteriales bacterium]MBK6551817.1 STAS domain-containing protein [Flavobacteriales bacterium]MBK6882344.1 STAS domain-containing protein [Flavobacteriales bacterium]MBK7101438.1 STAS domain-containing protein [Flavobacteriales bacterium]MBK7112147.1 STAS domain-containing protein [Flavobacteriales bacterium]
MNFTIEDKGRYTLVTSNVDKLDTTCAPELKSELVYLNKTNVRNVIIDLSTTRYCDSSGLSALLVANRLCKSVNGSLVVCGLQEPVQKLVQISQLESVLSITPTSAEAVDLLYMEEIEKDVNKD